MPASGFPLVNLVVDVVAFEVTAASLYFVARQKRSQYPYLKSLLVLVHVVFELIIVQDVLRTLAKSPSLVGDYTVFAASLVFVDVLLLTLIAHSVRVRPGGKGFRERVRSIFGRRPHGPILAAFIGYLAAGEAYLLLYRPFEVVQLKTLGGSLAYSPRFGTVYLAVTGLTLVFFVAYPTFLLVREGLSARDLAMRRRFFVLPFCWVGVGVEILLFNGLLPARGYDYIAVGYAVAAVLFGVTAGIFRQTSVLSAFFEPVRGASLARGEVVPSEVAPLDSSIPLLLEVDPSSNFEPALAALARGKTSAGGLVFVFTSVGSPSHNALQGIQGIRFYLMTGQVSYPTRTEKENQLLVPQNDIAVLLDLIDRTVSSTGGAPLLLVFDSATDLILYLGFESTYKFLKQANEIVSKPAVSTVYLVVQGAHDERTSSLLKSLFRKQLMFDAAGLRVTRGPGGPTDG